MRQARLAPSVSMSGGTLDVDKTLTLSGALTQSGDIEIDVKAGEVLTYSGAAVSLGANTLTLSGGGNLVSGGLTLNDASSKLLLNSITVDNVSTSVDNTLGLDVDANSTVSSLSVAKITPVAIAGGSSLSGVITVTNGSLKLTETGTLDADVSMSGGNRRQACLPHPALWILLLLLFLPIRLSPRLWKQALCSQQ